MNQMSIWGSAKYSIDLSKNYRKRQRRIQNSARHLR